MHSTTTLGIGVLLLVMIAVTEGSPSGYRFEDYVSALLSRHRRATDGGETCGKYCAAGKCANPPLRCNSCTDDQTLSADGSACLTCPVNCKRCVQNPNSTLINTAHTICEECNEAFRLSDTDKSVCEPCAIDGNKVTCRACQTSGAHKCDADTCYDGFAYSQPDTLCLPCALNCMKCAVPGKCHADQCMTGYRYDNVTEACKQCADGCLACNSTGAGKCDDISCRPGYAYRDQRCDACPGDCHNCTYKTVATVPIVSCDACHTGFVTNPATGLCVACPLNCDTCEYDVGANKAACRKCMPYWTVNTLTLECERCQTRTFNQVFTSYCSTCDTYGIGLCDKGDTDNPCEVTEFGYNTREHMCESCPAYCSNCSYSTELDAMVCLDGKCLLGYGYVQATGACTRCIDHCKSCDIGETCSSGQCTLGYSLVNGECIGCSTGCLVCTEPDTCTECQTGNAFVPDTEDAIVGTCTSCPRRCDVCEWDAATTTTKCTHCSAQNALFGQAASTCDECPAHCTACSIQNNGQIYCLSNSCESGYVYNIVDGSCVSCIENCFSCQQQSNSHGDPVCSVCDDQFAKTSDGTCEPCPANCDSCSYNSVEARTTCTTCDTPYKLNSATGQCVRCPEHCVFSSCTINIGITSCGACMYGYTEQGGQCPPCGSNCNACDYDTAAGQVKCLDGQCDSGFALTSDGNCDQCVTGCNRCHYETSTKICDECGDGYSDDGYGSCLQCTANCLSCSKDNSEQILCDKQGCAPGAYYVDASLAGGSLVEGTCLTCGSGCASCRNSNACDQCEPTYARHPATLSRCELCANCLDNECSWPTASDGTPVDKPVCAVCQLGFDHNNIDDCSACPAGCGTCSPDTENAMLCDSCLPSHVELTSDQACIVCPQGCSSCSISRGSVTCNVCMTGYVAVGDLCMDCDINCDHCTFTATSAELHCDTCATGYTADANGRCTTCATGYGTQDSACMPCPANCVTCTTAAECVTCESGYSVLSGGQCTACVVDNCEACAVGVSTQCSECSMGYVLDTASSQCDACDSLCQHCMYDADAILCKPFQCKAARVMGENFGCITCRTGCALCELSDASHNAAGDCITCKRGYIMDFMDMSCVACPTGCSFCTLTNGVTSCLNNHCMPRTSATAPAQIWNGTTCTDAVCAAGCDWCSTPDECHPQHCAQGFHFYDGDRTCIECDSTCDGGCSGTTASDCLSCASHHYSDVVSGTSTCTACNEGCVECSGPADTECTGDCAEGFVLDDGSCLACTANCKKCSAPTAPHCVDGYCMRGYVTDSESCSACLLNCDRCGGDDAGVGKCAPDSCSFGYYYVDANTCTECHASCDGCTGATADACINCADSFFSDTLTAPGTTTCTACSANCMSCNEANVCDACDATFGLDGSGGCSGCPDNCASCSLAISMCDPQACIMGFTWSALDGACIAVCDPPFYQSDGTCVGEVPGCSSVVTELDGVTGYCPSSQYCTAGYVWKAEAEAGGECILCNEGNCHVDNSGIAVLRQSGCSAGFTRLSDGSCAACSAACLSCDSRGQGKCDTDQCTTGYFLSSSSSSASAAYTCQLCDAHCATCAESSSTAGVMVCDTNACETGYVKATNGQCYLCPTLAGCVCIADASSAVCSSCAANAYLDTTTNICYACPSRCGTCSYHAASGGPLCDTCATNAHMHSDGRKCYECYEGCTDCSYNSVSGVLECADAGCDSGYTRADSGACFNCPTSCATCALDGYELSAGCMSCHAGTMYDTNANTCDSCVTGCLAQQCSSSSECNTNKCQAGYARDDATGQCHACMNCATCTASGGATTCYGLCNSGYYENADGDCVQCAANCDYCDNPTLCREQGCAPGYSIDDNHVCQSCSQTTGCEACSIVQGSVYCFACANTYFLSAGTCLPCAANCHGCSRVNECNSGGCDSGYAYNPTSKTCMMCPNNCNSCQVESGVAVCSTDQCVAGYGPTDPDNIGTCGECSTNCEHCSARGAGKCDSCTDCHICLGSAESYCFPDFGLTEDFRCGSCATSCQSCSCTGANKCDLCDAGYARDPTTATCFQCPPHCSNCQYVVPAGATNGVTQCSVCDGGFIINPNDKTCEPCPDSCDACTYNAASETDSSLPVTRCNSLGCQAAHVYRSSDGACPACPAHCLTCSVNATSGHTMCTPSGCHTNNARPCCEVGYGLVTAALTCSECPQDCMFCNDNGQAVMVCATCDYSFTPNVEECRPCTEHCTSCAKSGYNGQVCYECEDSPHDWLLIASDSCEACMDHCAECTDVSGAVHCADTMCNDHYAKNSGGQCTPCATLAFSGCSMCEDFSAGVAECTECMEGYTFNENRTACQQCDSSCPNNCADHKYACSECTSSMKHNREQTDCGFQCLNCSGDACLPEHTNFNETVVFCTTYCYSTNSTNNGVSTYEKGCKSTDACQQECLDRDNKKTELCTYCCNTDHCNTNLAASGVSVLVNTAFLLAATLLSTITASRRLNM